MRLCFTERNYDLHCMITALMIWHVFLTLDCEQGLVLFVCQKRRELGNDDPPTPCPSLTVLTLNISYYVSKSDPVDQLVYASGWQKPVKHIILTFSFFLLPLNMLNSVCSGATCIH